MSHTALTAGLPVQHRVQTSPPLDVLSCLCGCYRPPVCTAQFLTLPKAWLLGCNALQPAQAPVFMCLSHRRVEPFSSALHLSLGVGGHAITLLHDLLLLCCSEQLRHWGKRGLSPPREEDRKLPLHKLFENLQEFEQTVPASVCHFLLHGRLCFGRLCGMWLLVLRNVNLPFGTLCLLAALNASDLPSWLVVAVLVAYNSHHVCSCDNASRPDSLCSSNPTGIHLLSNSSQCPSQPLCCVQMEPLHIAVSTDLQVKSHVPAGVMSPLRSTSSSPITMSEHGAFSRQTLGPTRSQFHATAQRGGADERGSVPQRPASSCSDRLYPSQVNGRNPYLNQFGDPNRRITADQLLDRDRPGMGSQYLAARALAPEDLHLSASSSAPPSKVPSRDSSPLRDVNGLMHMSVDPSLVAPLVSAPLARTKSGTVKPAEDLHKEKELRRKQAADAMKNMEFKSLEGLDSFGLSRGCKNSMQALSGLATKFKPSPFSGSGTK